MPSFLPKLPIINSMFLAISSISNFSLQMLKRISKKLSIDREGGFLEIQKLQKLQNVHKFNNFQR